MGNEGCRRRPPRRAAERLVIRRRLLNAVFDAVTLSETVSWARDHIRRGRRGIITTVNVAILMMMRDNPDLQRFIDQSTLTVADGQPLVWYSRLRRRGVPERVTGVDLIVALCSMAATEGFGVYLLGAEGEVVERVADRLTEAHPKLKICGIADGYFGSDEASSRARTVRDSGADILFVAMGVPRQERFLEEHWASLGVSLAVPVGGGFEVIAGTKKRAPVWIQRAGLEWLYRVVQEPRRLWKRYLVTNTQFLYLSVLDLLLGERLWWRTPRR
jgi:N-acetylglucosaminyldiphosphoundecaprenol N-acetyl-beta-D-mannosaminyltransferase